MGPQHAETAGRPAPRPGDALAGSNAVVLLMQSQTFVALAVLLVAGILAVNYGLMVVVTHIMPLAIGKILVELMLYPLSFYMQRKYVFPPESEEARLPE